MSEPIPFPETYLSEARSVLGTLSSAAIDGLAVCLRRLRDRMGRLFICGLGGSAATASHAVNDFRKLCDLEAYCPTDNVAELTAWANDDNFTCALADVLAGMRPMPKDAALFLSVSGESPALLSAAAFLKGCGVPRYAILGRDASALHEFVVPPIVVPCAVPERRTAHAEETMAVVLHCLVSHPLLQAHRPAWEAHE